MRLSPFFTRTKPITKGIISDPQRKAIYNIERELIGTTIHTHCKREHLEAVMRHACQAYDVKIPRLVIIQKSQRIFGSCLDDRIELNAKFHGDNLHTLIHELAHWIADCLYKDAKESHGSEFVKIYSDLLDSYKLLPIDAFQVIAARYNI